MKEGPERIVLNLEDLEYITSSGVGVIAAAYTSARRAGKTLLPRPDVPRRCSASSTSAACSTSSPHYDSEDEAASGP